MDDEDFEFLNKFKWRLMGQGQYVTRHQRRAEYTDLSKRKVIRMHNQIMNPLKGFEVDHVNLNPLDNQKKNLRIATRTQNQVNTKKRLGTSSIYKGAFWNKKNQIWLSSICFNHKHFYIGRFKTAIEAAHAYDLKAKELFGKFARLNFA